MEPAGPKTPPSTPSPERKSPSPSHSPPKVSQIALDALQISKPTEFRPVSLTAEQKEALRKHQDAKAAPKPAAASKGLDEIEKEFFLMEETPVGVFQGKEYPITLVVDRIINLINNNPGLTTEQGVFRISGNNALRAEKLALLRNNPKADLPPYTANQNIHDLIYMLKGVLREKKEAVLEQEAETLKKMTAVVNEKDPELQKTALKDYVNSLKDDQKKILQQILPLVVKVIENQKTTNMDPKNIATTLGPTLSPDAFGSNYETITKVVNPFAEVLFTHAAEVAEFLNRK